MADGRYLGKIEKSPYLSNDLSNRHEVLHGDTFWPSYPPLKFPHFKNPRWRRPPFWKIKISPYLSTGLTDRQEIWHRDARWLSWPFRPLKFSNFKNPRWRQLPFWKIEILPYLSNGLTDRRQIWRDDALWPSWPFPPPKFPRFWKSKMVAAAILKNRKIVISHQRFNHSPWNLAWWHIFSLLTLATLKNSEF